jgi:hypothetical protein
MRARLHPGEIVLLPGGSQTSWQNVLASIIGAERLSVYLFCRTVYMCEEALKITGMPVRHDGSRKEAQVLSETTGFEDAMD